MQTNITVVNILLLLITVACRLDQSESTSEPEFVAISQQKYGSITKYAGFLIKKVHQPKIRIVYGFSDNNHCGRQFTGQYEKQLKDSLIKSLRVWLAPLANRNKIVNRFEFEHKKTHKDHIGSIVMKGMRKFKYKLWVFGNPDLSIIFYCKQGRSHAWGGITHMQIHLHQQQEHYIGQKGVSDLRKYSLGTLHHEVGHAFCLGDTYVDTGEKPSWWIRYNVSDGGAANTTGNQPISVMNNYYLIAIDSSGKLQLGEDDIAGINWLYDFHVAKNINSRSCPAEYHYERSTKGCVPNYPFIFAIKQNNLGIAKKMLLEDPTININRQDELGNTALHYAANAQKIHGGMLYHYLLHKGGDANIKNNNGDTPSDLAGENKTRTGFSKGFTNTLLAVFKRQLASPALLELIGISLQKPDGIEKTKKILKKVNINARSNDATGSTVLHQAVIKNKANIVEFLLTHATPDVNIQSKLSEETALHYAARYGHLEIAKLLLAQTEIDVTVEDRWSKTPLNRAMQEGQVEVRSAIIDFINDRHSASIPPTVTVPLNNNGNQPAGSGN